MASYKKLIVWQKAFRLSISIYQLTDQFPQAQTFSLCDQMQRAAVSIMSNIAEGSRRTRNEWKQFVRIAFASAGEFGIATPPFRGSRIWKEGTVSIDL